MLGSLINDLVLRLISVIERQDKEYGESHDDLIAALEAADDIATMTAACEAVLDQGGTGLDQTIADQILDALREDKSMSGLRVKSASDFIERLRGPLIAIENELDTSGDFAGSELAQASHAIANAAFALEDNGDWARAAEYLDEALTILDSDEVTDDGGMAGTIAALETLMEEARGGEDKSMSGLKTKSLDPEAIDAIRSIKNKIEEVLQANLSEGGLDRGGREDAETWADEMVSAIDDLTQTIASGSFTDASYELEDIIQSANSAGLEDELQRLQNYLEGNEDAEEKSLKTKTNYSIEGIQSELREWVGLLHDAVSDGKFDGLTGVSEMLEALGQAAGSDDAREMRGFLEEAGEWAKDNDRLDFLEGIGTMIDDLNEILQDTRPEDEPMSARRVGGLRTKGPSRARAAVNALRSAANGDDAVTVACDDLLGAIDDGDMGAIMSAWEEIHTAAGESYLDEIEVLDEALETIQYGKSMLGKGPGRGGHLSESFARLDEAIGDAKADVISDDVWDALDRAQVATWNEEIDEVEKWLQRAANLVGSPDSPTNKDAKVSAAIDDILEMLKDVQPEGMDERTMKSSGETIVTVHLTEPLPDGGSALETQIADLAESPGLIGQGRVVDTGIGMDIVYRFSDGGYATDFCSDVLDIPEVSGVDVEEAGEERTMNPSQRAADLLRRGLVTDLNAVDVGPNEIGDAMRVKGESFFDEFDFDWDALAEEASTDPVAGNYPGLADALSSRGDKALRSAIRSGSGSGEGMSEDLKNLIDEFNGFMEERSLVKGKAAKDYSEMEQVGEDYPALSDLAEQFIEAYKGGDAFAVLDLNMDAKRATKGDPDAWQAWQDAVSSITAQRSASNSLKVKSLLSDSDVSDARDALLEAYQEYIDNGGGNTQPGYDTGEDYLKDVDAALQSDDVEGAIRAAQDIVDLTTEGDREHQPAIELVAALEALSEKSAKGLKAKSPPAASVWVSYPRRLGKKINDLADEYSGTPDRDTSDGTVFVFDDVMFADDFASACEELDGVTAKRTAYEEEASAGNSLQVKSDASSRVSPDSLSEAESLCREHGVEFEDSLEEADGGIAVLVGNFDSKKDADAFAEECSRIEGVKECSRIPSGNPGTAGSISCWLVFEFADEKGMAGIETKSDGWDVGVTFDPSEVSVDDIVALAEPYDGSLDSEGDGECVISFTNPDNAQDFIDAVNQDGRGSANEIVAHGTLAASVGDLSGKAFDADVQGLFDVAIDALSGDSVSALQDARRLYVGGDIVGASDAVNDVCVSLGALCPPEVVALLDALDGQPENTEGFGMEASADASGTIEGDIELEEKLSRILTTVLNQIEMIDEANENRSATVETKSGEPTLTVEDEGPNPSTAFSDAKAALDDAGIEYELENNGWTLICEDTPEAREVLDSVGVSYESKSAAVSHRAISNVNPNQDKADEIRAYMDRVQSCTGDDLDAVEDILSDKPRGLDEDCKNDLVDVKDALKRAYAGDRSGDTQEAEDARDDLAQALSALWDSLDSLASEFEDESVDSASAIDIDIRRAAEEVANS